MQNFETMFLGGLLVALGVVASAIADRIRGIKVQRMVRQPVARRGDAFATSTQDSMRCDVIAALVQAGYSKHEAAEAVAGVPSSACSTLESWTRAALKKLASRVS
jgi:Holliday junction resolvasome RuvABC DNA-binding subunit